MQPRRAIDSKLILLLAQIKYLSNLFKSLEASGTAAPKSSLRNRCWERDFCWLIVEMKENSVHPALKLERRREVVYNSIQSNQEQSLLLEEKGKPSKPLLCSRSSASTLCRKERFPLTTPASGIPRHTFQNRQAGAVKLLCNT